MIRFAIATFFALTSLAQSAEPRMTVGLRVVKAGTTYEAIDAIKAGEQFDLVLIVQDKRKIVEGMRRGVFAAYCNLGYSKRYADLQWVEHTPPFTDAEKKSRVVTPAGLGPWGGMRGLGGGDTEPIEVSRIRFRALWPANIAPGLTEASTIFRCSVTGLRSPHFDTLLYGTKYPDRDAYYPGEVGTVKPEEITVRGVALRILK